MSGLLFPPPFITALDDNGAPISGATLTFYLTGTSTLATVYSDAAMTTPLDNPVEADAAGRFPAIYIGSDVLRAVLKDAGGSVIPGCDIDPVSSDIAAELAASGGSASIGFIQAGAGAVARTAQAKMRERVSVDDYGAVGDGIADDMSAIQATFDANPTATICGTHGKTYRSSGPIVLVNAGGKNFQGDIDGNGCTFLFATAGSAVATDANMENGFVVYPTLNATGGDITGLRQSSIRNMLIQGPANGAGFRLANSQNVEFSNIRTLGQRYGIVNESCINVQYSNCTFEDYHNAGVGLIRSANPNIWYRDPATAWWNDSPTFINCGFKNGYLTQPLAHILDHGSSSLSPRKVIGCYFYSRWDAPYVGSNLSTQYGIVSRNGQWSIDSSWFENTTYPIRILEANSLEPASLTGVIGAQPSGTYAVSNFPDGFAYSYSCSNTWFARAFIEQEVSGVRGAGRMTGNVSLLILNGATNIKSITTNGSQLIIDDGAAIVSPQGTYSYTSFVSGVYIDDPGQWQAWTPTVTASSGTITTLGTIECSYAQRGKVVHVRGTITITTNGTGAGTLQISVPVTAKADGGVAVGIERAVSGDTLAGQIASNTLTLRRYDNTYPGVDGAVIVFSGTYEAA